MKQPEEEITPGEKKIRKATPKELTTEIDIMRRRVMRRCEAMLRSVVEVGELLAEANEILDDEAFLKWLDKDVCMTRRLAGKYVELAADRKAQSKAVPGMISGALGLNLCDEVQLPPDPHHIVKGHDMNNVTLYIWPADPRGERLHAFAMNRTPGKAGYWEGLREPLLASHVPRILIESPPCGFHFSNAHFEILPAGPRDLDRLDDMRARYAEKSEANGEGDLEF